MHTTRLALAIGGALFVATSAAGAQGRGHGNNGLPPGQMPSAGMCRIWIDGLPPGQQAAQTDCDTARRTVPANGRILYGPSVGTTTANQGDPRRGTGNGQSGNVDPRRSGTYGQGVGAGDPRRSGNGRYDGRYDGRNRAEDRDDDHDGDHDRHGHHDSRYDNRAAERARIAREQERQARMERERQRVEQARIERERKLAWERERAAQRERERLAREERRRDRERQRQQPTQSSTRVYPEQQPASRPVRTVFGTVQTVTPAGCVDANRDGVCDSTDPRKH